MLGASLKPSISCSLPFSLANFAPLLSKPDRLFKYLIRGGIVCRYKDMLNIDVHGKTEIQISKEGYKISEEKAGDLLMTSLYESARVRSTVRRS